MAHKEERMFNITSDERFQHFHIESFVQGVPSNWCPPKNSKCKLVKISDNLNFFDDVCCVI